MAEWQTARDQVFWIALAVLRFLSPIPKSDPSPVPTPSEPQFEQARALLMNWCEK
jgi:hypothetical protein